MRATSVFLCMVLAATQSTHLLNVGAILGVAGSDAGAISAGPSVGDVKKLVTAEVFVPDSALSAMSASGIIFDGGGHYQTLQARFWYFQDGGLDVGPSWPSGVIVLSLSAPAVCASATLCLAYDGGIDVARAAASGCFCAVDNTCTGTAPDGGLAKAVPHGFTLPGAGWTAPFSGNCQAKACGDLWANLPDGGSDTSWPSACPLN